MAVQIDGSQGKVIATSGDYSGGVSIGGTLSYEDVESERSAATAANEVTMDATSIQASYTIGGMTLSVSHDEFDNLDYTSGNKMNETLFAAAISFKSLN